MKISARTKISDLINHNPKAIDAIVSINRHFNKLKNPVLRKLLAGRVTIADASRIGGCTVNDFFDKLSGLGFESEETTMKTETENSQIPLPDFLSDKNISIVELDVRKDLESGVDPFNKIMKAIKELGDTQVLKIINTFEPIPLIKILEDKGYKHFVTRENNLVITYFKKGRIDQTSSAPEKSETVSFEELELKKEAFGGKIKEIDVRDLEMPLPMVTILSELESLPGGFALYVHHKKIPAFLLPELKKRNYAWCATELGMGDVKMLIYKT